MINKKPKIKKKKIYLDHLGVSIENQIPNSKSARKSMRKND